MKSLNTNLKGQGLALNTIVIAILVIIVLLVIIVFFTTQVGDTGDQLEENSASQCTWNNPAISTLYSEDEYDLNSPDEGDSCGENANSVTGVSNCCIKEKNSNSNSNSNSN